MCCTGAHTHGCNKRRRDTLAKQAQGEKQIEKRSEERWRKRGRGHKYKKERNLNRKESE